MNRPHYVRSTSHNAQKATSTQTRPAKPSALKKTQGNRQNPALKSPTSLGKTRSGGSKSTEKSPQRLEVNTDEDDDVEGDQDMAGLPHFCATCEKQIITPGGSILYCSESCRRKDGSQPLTRNSLSFEFSPLSPHFADSQMDIIPQRSPTQVRPPSLTFSDYSETSSTFDSRQFYGRSQSEASHYLAQFRSPEGSPERQRSRPLIQRAYTSNSHSNIPSLSHTPGSLTNTPPSFSSHRPLPCRHNPFTASFSSHSVDLVTPILDAPSFTASGSPALGTSSLQSFTSTTTAVQIEQGQLSYEKKSRVSNASPSKGSLKQLFSHDAMTSAPPLLSSSSSSKRGTR